MSKKYFALLLMAVMMLFAVNAVAAEGDPQVTDAPCTHTWTNDGAKYTCSGCGKVCDHTTWKNETRFGDDSVCDVCGYVCEHLKHNPSAKCYYCKQIVAHDYDSNGKCMVPECQYQCPHTETTLVPTQIGNCIQIYVYNVECNECNAVIGSVDGEKDPDNHDWKQGRCNNCGLVCIHSWTGDEGNRKCEKCDMTCNKCDYKVTTLIAGSCTSKGYYKKVCRTCGNTVYYYDFAHTYVWTHKPATCTENGKVGMACALCGKPDANGWTYLSDEEEPKLNHPKSMWIVDKTQAYKAPTCNDGGFGTFVCSCGFRMGRQELDPLGHDWNVRVEVTVPANCDHAAYVGHPCNRCDAIDKLYDVPGSSVVGQHKPEYKTQQATCIADGYENRVVCTVCGKVLAEGNTLTNGAHKYVVTNVLREATCTQVGVERVKCSLCNDTTIRVTGLKHDYKPASDYVPATCNSDAAGQLVCAKCGKIVNANTIEKATGKHNWVENYIKAGTCRPNASEDEKKSWVGTFCSVCETPNPLAPAPQEVPGSAVVNHKYIYDYERVGADGKLIYKASTCTKKGQAYATKCSVCGTGVWATVTLPLAKHEYGGMQEIPATCTHGLLWGKVCVNCGDIAEGFTTVDETLAPHKYQEYKQEATCLQEGFKYSQYCPVCKTCGSENVVTPLAKEHKYATVAVLREATCTVPGVKKVQCTVKGCTENNTIQVQAIKAEHKWDKNSIQVVKPETCGAAGIYKHTCSVCQKTENYTVKATGKHNYAENFLWAATCTEAAKFGKLCTVCGAAAPGTNVTVVEGSTKLGHKEVVDENYVDATGKLVYIAPTCTKAGLGYKYCSRCNEQLGLKVLPALNHKWGDNKLNAEGTVMYHTCKNCGMHQIVQVYGPYDKDDECAIFEHTAVAIAAVMPDCTNTGLTEGSKCSVCDKVLVAQEVIPAMGHTEEEIAAVEATCTATGLTAGKKCSVCGVITVAQEEVAKKPHAFNGAEKCPDCGEANPDYTNHVHEYTVKWSLHPTDKTKKVATYTCVNKIGDKECTSTYTKEYGLFETVAK